MTINAPIGQELPRHNNNKFQTRYKTKQQECGEKETLKYCWWDCKLVQPL